MPANLNPDDTDVLRDGEFMALNRAATGCVRAGNDQTWVLGGSSLSAAGFSNLPSYMLYAERGRTDIQSIGGGGKVPLIWRGTYEVNTQLYSETLDTATAFEVGNRLAVISDPAENGGYATFSVVGFHATQGFTVGYVTKRVADNGSNGLRMFCQAGGFGIGV